MILFLILGGILFFKIILVSISKKDNSGKILLDNLEETREDLEDDIDAIITWIDSSDKYWQQQRNKFYLKETGVIDNRNVRFPNPEFSDNELYFCVASINKYLPWIRNIFIITCFNQKPSWIDKFPKIKIVDHKDIIPNEYLPTFNTNVIEAYIHRIKNLSEKFIYFNDDFYVNRYLKKNFFFYKNYPIMTCKISKLPLYYTNKLISKIYLFIIKKLTSTPHYIIISMNSKYFLLLNKKYASRPCHVALPLTKRIMYDLENKFSNEFIITGNSKFRSPSDLRITYLAANSSSFVSKYFNNNKSEITDQCLFCINNISDKNSNLELRKFFQEKHNIIYPAN
jgi:hypothetical protein